MYLEPHWLFPDRVRWSSPASWPWWTPTTRAWSPSRPSSTSWHARPLKPTLLNRSWPPSRSWPPTRWDQVLSFLFTPRVSKQNLREDFEVITKTCLFLSSSPSSLWRSFVVNSHLSRPSTASAAWPSTPALKGLLEPWITSPSPAPSTERAIYKRLSFSPSFSLLSFSPKASKCSFRSERELIISLVSPS